MSGREAPLYRRGKYWLDKLRREDGTDRSPRWYIFWYDPAARREASVSTGTAIDDVLVYRDDEANPPLIVTLTPGKDNVKVAKAGDDMGEEAA